MVVEVRFRVQDHLRMVPELKHTVPIGKLCARLDLRDPVGVLRTKYGDLEDEVGNGCRDYALVTLVLS